MRDPRRLGLFVAGLALLLSGCIVGPRYTPPTPPAAPGLVGANAPTAATPLSRVEETPADLATWWRGFGDPRLDSLVDRALAANLDRQTAASRVREAHAATAAARADLFPSVNGNVEYNHTHISQNAGLSSFSGLLGGGGSGGGSGSGSGGGSGSGSGNPIATAGFPGLEFDTYTVGLSADWSPDLFGGNTSATRAARRREEAQAWSARDTDVTVVSEIAQAYFALREDQARIAVLQANAKSQNDLLNLLSARARGGIGTDVDTTQQRSQLASTLAQVPPVEADASAQMHALAVLLDMAPDTLAAELAPAADPQAALPAAMPVVPVGLTSDLLKRRPDVRQAERNLAASVADVDQATAALYPQLQLNGSFDFVSTTLKHLLDIASRNYTAGAALMEPLFDAGKLRAQKHQSEERAIQAALTYRKTALTALQQTADALARYGADQRQIQSLQIAYTNAAQAVALDRAQYFGGLSDLTATLRAETTASQTQDQLTQARAQLSVDLVALYKALGGGWSEAQGSPPRPTLNQAENGPAL